MIIGVIRNNIIINRIIKKINISNMNLKIRISWNRLIIIRSTSNISININRMNIRKSNIKDSLINLYVRIIKSCDRVGSVWKMIVRVIRSNIRSTSSKNINRRTTRIIWRNITNKNNIIIRWTNKIIARRKRSKIIIIYINIRKIKRI